MSVSKPLIIGLIVGVVVLVLIIGAVLTLGNKQGKDTVATSETSQTIAPAAVSSPASVKNDQEWQEVGAALAGTYADADIVTLGDGTHRMYAATQPEVAGNKLEIYSATSKDGVTWTKEAGTRKTMATFPDIMKLDDGTYRMNYQNAGVIKSATSKDGLTFTDEAGTRVDKTTDTGIALDNVAAPSTLKLSDGTYLMVYRGSINEPYAAETVPNKTMGVVMYATSTDGKTWTKKGLAIDTRTDTTLKGWADGPELVEYDDEIRVYFTNYSGIYYSVYKDGSFTKPQFSWQLSGGIPPGDPTLLKVGTQWYMYYGRHPEGIYYAKPTNE